LQTDLSKAIEELQSKNIKNGFNRERYQANQELTRALIEFINERPSERFSQILRNCGFIKETIVDGPPEWVNEFYLESKVLLKRIKK